MVTDTERGQPKQSTKEVDSDRLPEAEKGHEGDGPGVHRHTSFEHKQVLLENPQAWGWGWPVVLTEQYPGRQRVAGAGGTPHGQCGGQKEQNWPDEDGQRLMAD